MTLSQVGNMEKQLNEEQQAPLLTEYRFFRNRVGTSLSDATTSSTDNSTFLAIFESMSETFRRMAQEKGYDFEVVLAGSGIGLERTEYNYTSYGWPDRKNDTATGADDDWYNEGYAIPPDGTLRDGTVYGTANAYWIYSHDGAVDLAFAPSPTPWDGVDDGIVWVANCETAPGTPCLQAAVVLIRMADTSATIMEYVVYALNAA